MPNDIRTFLDASNVLVDINARCKREVLRKLSVHAAQAFNVDESGLLESLQDRELIGTTGIGNGVAVPHARTGLSSLHGVFARLQQPVDFDAIDDRPVDLVFMLLAPHEADAAHLKCLSRIARMMRATEVRDAMRGAKDADALYAIAVEHTRAAAA